MPQSGPHPQLSAADALAPAWRRQARELTARESELRSGRETSAHGYRTAARRLRSNLAAFRPLFEGNLPAELTADLRRAVRSLGGPRDAEMLADRVTRLLADEPDGIEVARVRTGLLELLDSMARESGGVPTAYFDSDEYDVLVRRLDRFSDLPPWSPVARGPAADVLRAPLKVEWKRFRGIGAAALAAPHDPSGDARLQATRKAAERARYVAESLVPVFGRRARRMAEAAGRVRDVLGEHRDCAVTRELLAGPALASLTDPDDRFVLGRLHAREQARSERLRDDYARLFRAADRKALRRWM
jgi:CHAD domain-containing protein